MKRTVTSIILAILVATTIYASPAANDMPAGDRIHWGAVYSTLISTTLTDFDTDPPPPPMIQEQVLETARVYWRSMGAIIGGFDELVQYRRALEQISAMEPSSSDAAEAMRQIAVETLRRR